MNEQPMSNKKKPTIHPPLNIVEKSWGREIWFANNPLYCGKILEIKPHSTTSMHYHMTKDETLYVMSGTLRIAWLKTDEGIQIVQIVSPGNSIRIRPGQPHRLKTTDEPVVIFEVSTEHFDSDSFRIPQNT